MRVRRMPMQLPSKLIVPFKTVHSALFLAGAPVDQSILINSMNNLFQLAAGSEKRPQYWDGYFRMGYRFYYVRKTTVYARIIPAKELDSEVWLGFAYSRNQTPPAYSAQTERENFQEMSNTRTMRLPQTDDPKIRTAKFVMVTKVLEPYKTPESLGAQWLVDPSEKIWFHTCIDLSAATAGDIVIDYAVYSQVILYQLDRSPVQ